MTWPKASRAERLCPGRGRLRWDTQAEMRAKGPVLVMDHFQPDREALVTLLRSLRADEWERPTACPGWSVQDVAAHILGDDLGQLSRARDNHHVGSGVTETWGDLVSFVNRWNEQWVDTARRLSPALVTDLLDWSGPQVVAYFRTLDLLTPGPPVSWADPGPAPRWLHVAREYTERWIHQEQIRDAVGTSGLRSPDLFAPVLNTFVHALPHTYRDMAAAENTHVLLEITGNAGGIWSLVRQDRQWGLFEDVSGPPAATVTFDEDTAWRLFTRGITSETARARVSMTGDQELGGVLLTTVAIIA